MGKRSTSRYRSTVGHDSAPARRRLSTPFSGRKRGLGRSRELAILAAFGAVVVLAVAGLAGALLMAKMERDWAAVATINGQSINRETLRAREKVIAFLAQERAVHDADKADLEVIPAEHLIAVRAEAMTVLADPIGAARESLIDDELVRQLAAREGVATPAAPDPWAEALAYVGADLAYQARVVRFGLPAHQAAAVAPNSGGGDAWPPAAAGNVEAATARLRSELAAGKGAKEIADGLIAAGWTVYAADLAVSDKGVPSDGSLDLDPVVAVAVMDGGEGDVVGPGVDVYGRVTMARLLRPADTTSVRNHLPADAADAEVDTAALQEWANGRALRRSLEAHLLTRWKSGDVSLARSRQLVIGDAPAVGTEGPWVELYGLALDRLGSVDPSTVPGAPPGLSLQADELLEALRGSPMGQRLDLFRSLAQAANAALGSAPASSSAELGFSTKDGLVTELGDAAFDAKVRSGDILGPIVTSSGSQLFLVEARFGGILDERSRSALQIVRADSEPDLVAYTTRYSPGDVALAADAGWRSDIEFGPDEAARSALFDTPLGLLSDPFVLDGKLVLAVVDERLSGRPDERTAARIQLDGYAAWFGGEGAKASITRSENPLPELAASPSAVRTMQPVPVMPTPNPPTAPGP